jgi:transposase-like protein
VQSFADRFAEFPKATAKITGELDTLLAFFDFPAEHWVHLRSTNPIWVFPSQLLTVEVLRRPIESTQYLSIPLHRAAGRGRRGGLGRLSWGLL